jgi:ATP-binding cassette subfamily B protein
MLTVGTVAFFVLTLSNLFAPVQQLSQLFNLVQSAGAGLQKLYELLDTDVDVDERPGAVDLPDAGDITVGGVGCSTPGSPVPSRRDPADPLGRRLALVGPTGAGKSTLAKLIARLARPRRVPCAARASMCAMPPCGRCASEVVVVPQRGFLFNGAMLDNDAPGPRRRDRPGVLAARQAPSG